MSTATDRISVPMIVLLGALTAYAAISIDLYLPSLPAIAHDFGVDGGRTQQTLTAFFLGMTFGQLVYGPLSDRLGRRPLLLAGSVIYVLASLGCALAPSVDWMIGARFVQALGGCAGVVLARVVVRDRYGHQASARIYSMLTLVMGVAPLFAPTLGGWVVTYFNWRAIFFLLAGFGAILGIAVLLALPESRSQKTAQVAQGESVWASYRHMLREPRFVGYMLAGALNGACLFTYISTAPDLIIVQLGFTPRTFGLIFSLMAVGVIGSSQVNRMLLLHAASDRILAYASLGSLVVGAALLFAAHSDVGGTPLLLASLFAVLSSNGLMNANTQAGALSIDPYRAGSASALLGATASAAGALAAFSGGVLHNGTAVPMAAVMMAALILSAVALYALALPRTLVPRLWRQR